MHQLSDTITRKFTDVIDLDDWEIETPDGWEDISQIMQTVEYDVWRIEFEDGLWIECADDHILIRSDGSEIFAKNLKPYDLIKSVNGISVVKSAKFLGYQEQMYDVQVESASHHYYSNGLVSHNTTCVGAYILHKAIFTKDYRIAVLANKGDTAREILSRIKSMFEDLPWFLKPGVVEWNKGSVEFSNGTRIISASTSNSGIRGQSMNLIYLDEMAFIQNDVEFFASTYPVISAGKTTKVIITSTPNGMNLFYKMWMDAVNGKSDFKPKQFLWDAHPDRDEKWKLETLRNISQKQFDQEFLCAFMGSSDTLISGSKLQQLAFTDPIETSDNFNMYEAPIEKHAYAITVDVSEGIGKDYSVASVFDITQQPYKHVAVYRDNTITPILYSDVVHKIAMKYNEAYVVVESNSIGKITADSLYYDYEYENMLMVQVKDKENVAASGGGSIGIRTTRKTKAIGCSSLKSMIESDTLITNDFQTINELTTFIKKGTSFEAEKTKTDDIVMTLVIFCWFATQPFFEDVTNENMRARIKDNYAMIEDQNHLVFGFFNDGIQDDSDGMFS